MSPLLAAVVLAQSAAVIVIGDDGEAVATLQTELRRELSSVGVNLLDMDALAAAIPDDEPDAKLDALIESIEAGLAKALEAYESAQLPTVLAQLEIVEESLARAPPLGKRSSRYHLLRAATYLDDGDDENANYHVAKALHFDIDTTPDPSIFRPAVSALVSAARARVGAGTITLEPPVRDAQMSVNGLPPATSAKVVPGTHTVVVHADGFRARTLTVEVAPKSEAEIETQLALSVSPEIQLEIKSLTRGRKGIPPTLIERLNAVETPVLVVVQVGGGAAVGRIPETASFATPEFGMHWTVSRTVDAFAKKGDFAGMHLAEKRWRAVAGAGASIVTEAQSLSTETGQQGASRQATGYQGRLEVSVIRRLDVDEEFDITQVGGTGAKVDVMYRDTFLSTQLGRATLSNLGIELFQTVYFFRGRVGVHLGFYFSRTELSMAREAEQVELIGLVRLGFGVRGEFQYLVTRHIRLLLGVVGIPFQNLISDDIGSLSRPLPTANGLSLGVSFFVAEKLEIRGAVLAEVSSFRYESPAGTRVRDDAVWGGTFAVRRWF